MKRTVILLGIVILAISAGWLFWREWQQRVQFETLKRAGDKVVHQIPRPRPGTLNHSGQTRSSPKVESPAIQQPQPTKETAADDTTVDLLDSAAQRARSDSLEETPLVAARKKNDSGAETISLQQEDETEGEHAAEQSREEPSQERFVIQVGAFRNLSAAMNLKKALKEKGYDAYLDGRTLPNLGLMHRVRIRGYTSAAAAKADTERLKREEGLNSIVITSAQGARSDSLQETPLVVAREKSDSGAEEIPLQQENETEERGAVEQSSKKLSHLGYIIQVGAFRDSSDAEKLQKRLKEKGYDAYLDIRTLPNLGLMHRVRIRGYASAAAAKADMERLKREEGLNSIVMTLELD